MLPSSRYCSSSRPHRCYRCRSCMPDARPRKPTLSLRFLMRRHFRSLGSRLSDSAAKRCQRSCISGCSCLQNGATYLAPPRISVLCARPFWTPKPIVQTHIVKPSVVFTYTPSCRRHPGTCGIVGTHRSLMAGARHRALEKEAMTQSQQRLSSGSAEAWRRLGGRDSETGPRAGPRGGARLRLRPGSGYFGHSAVETKFLLEPKGRLDTDVTVCMFDHKSRVCFFCLAGHALRNTRTPLFDEQ